MTLVRPLLLTITAATRLLIVSPHPDDGTLAAGGLAARVIAAGGSVRLVQMTSGDAFSEGVKRVDRIARPTASDYRAYGRRRERETLAAMAAVGVDASHVTFLGFPDDGLCLLSSSYASTDFVSPYTQRTSPPPAERLLQHVEYRGRDVVRELEGIIAGFGPTIVVLPDPGDEHPDHCSTHRFTTRALEMAERRHPAIQPTVLHYVIHAGTWPASHEAPARRHLAPPAPYRAGAEWRALALKPAEAAAKRRAIEAYRTQTLVMGTFLRAFEDDNELFIEDEPAREPACWCHGENIAKP